MQAESHTDSVVSQSFNQPLIKAILKYQRVFVYFDQSFDEPKHCEISQYA